MAKISKTSEENVFLAPLGEKELTEFIMKVLFSGLETVSILS